MLTVIFNTVFTIFFYENYVDLRIIVSDINVTRYSAFKIML